eukprot:CAMPEP_0206546008 /NCGR_PEP_ID=MMETSP0325_2-20121206/12458_1 /ASSEMBLY_ACC=CAM_ASM_000347 /TAXON_ID=2866 /ORGANISM="Crypthecodinium cohnii, Strain Seligo" /LENGTH=305 /DNA_ID=CAMNT_0054045067 /DNA_START=1 /DNA_END=914 /DNA_ORIENTATION=+
MKQSSTLTHHNKILLVAATALFLAPGSWAISLRAGSSHSSIHDCGAAPTYANARPKNYADSRTEFFNTTSKKTEAVIFRAGDVIDFECLPGFSTDGSKEGSTVFQASCTESGYFKPSGVCVEASKCGPVPNITHALPTGKTVSGAVEFACSTGYSLDGENVVEGGLGKNRFFTLKCVEFSGSYEAFEGECKPYAFVASGETQRLYNELGRALFIVSCKGSLKTAFANGEIPSSIDNVCNGFEDSSAACKSLVSKIKSDFSSELDARKQHDEEANKDWYEEKEPNRPGIGEEATEFCTELWALLEL